MTGVLRLKLMSDGIVTCKIICWQNIQWLFVWIFKFRRTIGKYITYVMQFPLCSWNFIISSKGIFDDKNMIFLMKWDSKILSILKHIRTMFTNQLTWVFWSLLILVRMRSYMTLSSYWKNVTIFKLYCVNCVKCC